MAILIFLTNFSRVNLYIGNIFFGKFSSVYNVNLAQKFFKNAVYDFHGKPAEYAHYQLSRTYFIKGKLVEALFEAQKEIQEYPENYRTYYILGLTYGYLNLPDKAIISFEKFIENKPESWAARNDKAWLEFRIGKIDDALATMEPVASQTDNPWVQNTYGVLLMNKKRYKEASQAFTYAKNAADRLTPSEWGNTYPGNDPRVYRSGLEAMKYSIQTNIDLLEKNKK